MMNQNETVSTTLKLFYILEFKFYYPLKNYDILCKTCTFELLNFFYKYRHLFENLHFVLIFIYRTEYE